MQHTNNKTQKLLLYTHNLDKLLDQHIDWFLKRIEFAKTNDWGNVRLIEQKYLEPLDRKISSLTKIIQEVLHGR